jgi:hypothetical protein
VSTVQWPVRTSEAAAAAAVASGMDLEHII